VLLGLGGSGAVGVLVGRFGLPVVERTRGGHAPGVSSADTLRYVDHDGWIVTVDDTKKLGATAGEAPDR